jgi:hypothetical protein
MPPRSAVKLAPMRETSRRRIAAPSWLRPAIVALCAVWLMAWFSNAVADSDAWWHLRTGQYIWENRSLPVPDPFAFTTSMGVPAYSGEEVVRRFNLTHEWLAQTVFYLAYALAGFPGLVLFRAALLSGFCAVVGWLAFRRSDGFYTGVAAAWVAASIMSSFSADRPFIVTFFLLAVTVAILESRRFLWLLPPIFLVWANCHGGYALGWVVLAVYSGEALFFRWRGRPGGLWQGSSNPSHEGGGGAGFRLRADSQVLEGGPVWAGGDRSLWIVSALAILISGANPNGFRVVEVLLDYRKSVMQSQLWEWQHMSPWPPSMFSLVLAAGVVALLLAWRRARPVDWFLLCFFGAAAIMAVRNVALVALIGPVVIASYLPWKRVLPALAEFAAASALLIAIGVGIARGSAFQLRAVDWKYPSGAADFLLSHHVSGPMFNTYEDGGYLIWRLWPKERVFIDGRALNESVFTDFRRIAFNADSGGGPSGEQLLDHYGIQVIVMGGFEYGTGSVYLLPAALSDPKQTAWKLVYQDAQSVVYMRQPPVGVQPLNSVLALSSLEAQCELHLQNDPAHPGCSHGLADLFARIGDAARARRWLGIYLDHPHAPDPEAEKIFQRLVSSGR